MCSAKNSRVFWATYANALFIGLAEGHFLRLISLKIGVNFCH